MHLDDLNTFQQHESQVRSYCRTFPQLFSRGKGSFLYDDDNNAYIDFLAGAGALNFGHNNDEINQVVIDYLRDDGIVFGLDLHTRAKIEFIKAFDQIVLKPRQLDYKMQFTSPTGTSVVESAIKLARKVTGRHNVVSFTNAFHGMTATALSLTGSKGHRQPYPSAGVTRFPFEGYLGEGVDTIAYYHKLLTDPSSGVDLPAAVILETVQGEGGVNVASVSWLKQLRQLTEELGIVLIIDDIQIGCGRSGQFFSFEQSGIKPDIVCLSKSIGGNGLPLAVLLIKPAMDVWSPSEENGTFRGNNLAFVAATAMLQLFWKNPEFELQISNKVALIEAFFARLQTRFPAHIKATRGRGFMQGIELKTPAHTAAIAKDCFANSLLIETCGPHSEVLKLMPALTIAEDILSQGLAIIEQAFVKVCTQCDELDDGTEQQSAQAV
jgi:diaminobutyrate-2-oxoglutarate transaminase